MDISVSGRSETAGEATGTQAIGRAVGLLRLLASTRNRGASLGEMVEASGLAKPTCRRILLALIDAGLAEQDEASRRYYLGPEAYVLGTVAAERFGIHRLAREHVLRLARETGDAAFLQIRRDHAVVCLQREDGDYPLRSHVLAAGDRHPLGAGAGGITLLAALPDAEVEAVLAANATVYAERYPVLTREVLLGLVTEARATGYGINRGLLFPGSWGMGVVVRDAEGRPDACLSLAAVESRMQPDRQPELYRLLRQEADRLEARLRAFAVPADDRLSALAPAPVQRRRAGERRSA
ncbi:IclR family transcriptional regulator [Prosthecomicrobium sp. N25]|uniref:IclR family transcriptional regulator n=1 Tax=Prosthecomicrobium sp. N25 TaxID=3129254 RepID=UPI0030773046